MNYLSSLDLVSLRGKTVFYRCDMNVPYSNGKIIDDFRLKSMLASISLLRKYGIKIILASHFQRPKLPHPDFSLSNIVPHLQCLIGEPIEIIKSLEFCKISDQVSSEQSEIYCLENLRFFAQESKNDDNFAKFLASLADFYVNDAFSVCHREHASIAKLPYLLPSFAGIYLEKEIHALTQGLAGEKPRISIVGGAKISTKMPVLLALSKVSDYLIVGGGIANTFLVANGFDVQNSLFEEDSLGLAREFMVQMKHNNCDLVCPIDGQLSFSYDGDSIQSDLFLDNIPPKSMILDIGQATLLKIRNILQGAKSVLWNGPMGYFEQEPFDRGTVMLAKIIANLTAVGQIYSLAGGGETKAAIEKAGVSDKFSYISGAGGAFLEWISGNKLPGIQALKQDSNK